MQVQLMAMTQIAIPDNKSYVQCSTMKVINIERVDEWMTENFELHKA